MKEHKRITIAVSDDVYSRLKSHADNNDWTVPVLIRRTITDFANSDCLPAASNASDFMFMDSSGVVRLDSGCDEAAPVVTKSAEYCDPADTEVLATAEELLIARGQTGQSL